MINKKAQIKIVGIIIGIFILTIIIVGLIIANQKGYLFKETKEEYPKIDMYLKAVNEKTNEQIDASYVLSYLYNDSNLMISKGNLSKDSLTEVKDVPVYSLSTPINFYSWSEDYYYRRLIKFFDFSEITTNNSKSVCPLEEIGKISITHYGELKEGNNLISLNISTDKYYKKLSICTAWTPGIIYVSPKNSMIICDKGNWINWSFYNATTKKYTYYENDYYRCGDSKQENLEQCEYIKNNRCQSYSMKTPFRYLNKVDNCFYTGKILNDESYLVEFDVKTSNLNQLDEITFYITDKDKRWDESEQMWLWKSEDNYVNIGAEDTEYKVRYLK